MSLKAEPLIVLPKQEHKQSFILLHGRGDRAQLFGAGILSTYLADARTLRQVFPTAKFIFLQAPLRELAVDPRTKFYQWFDVWSLRPGSEETDLQIPGLRETVHLVHGTLAHEIALVGAENVVLGGLSQGCASSLISLLLWDGPAFAACVGMCGWLPFRKLLETVNLQANQSRAEKSSEDTALQDSSPERTAITALAKKLGYADSFAAPLVYQKVPLILSHGTDDNVVVMSLGQEAASCFTALRAKVSWKEYEGLTHWYSPSMIQDIVEFLHAETKWNGLSTT